MPGISLRAAESRRSNLRLSFGALVAGLAIFSAHVLLGVGDSASTLLDNWLYDALMVDAGVVCLARVRTGNGERAAWLLIAIGLLCWAGGDVYWNAAFANAKHAPTFSGADVLYLAYYPFVCAGLVLLLRSTGSVTRNSWLDGLSGALVVAAFATQFVLSPVLEKLGGSVWDNAITLAYPLGDTILLGFLVAVLAISCWRVSRAWALLIAALTLAAVADCVYSYQAAAGTYVSGGALDILWPASAVLVAFAAWQPVHVLARGSRRGWWLASAPALFAAIAFALRGYQRLFDEVPLAEVLIWGSVALISLRLILGLIENQRLLERTRTDPLTGLGNRLKLDRDIASADGPAAERTLTLFDLDGFKLYNDTFGHPAGDVLLARLGRRLAVSARNAGGEAYRVGGDEFCALLPSNGDPSAVAACTMALGERGEGFEIGSSFGTVELPSEASSVAEALALADQRMYQQKDFRRVSAGGQAKAVLLRTLFERQPAVREHVVLVRELALAVGTELGLDPQELLTLGQAAELHDIGKVAIPDAILQKPGPLDEEEWTIVRQHTILGARILSSAPALVPVARIVRASHERWDGTGYPDGIAAHEIPLAARIIFVCKAFHAITGDRPYRKPQSQEEALEELRRFAGKQFDPDVVEAFCRMIAANPKLAAHAFSYREPRPRPVVTAAKG
jgi:two-component system, cell cycle response regulator